MGTLEGARTQAKKVTIPNVPQDLWRAFQEDHARRQHQSVGNLIVTLMSGALGGNGAGIGPEPE
jgi:hypothetical protein